MNALKFQYLTKICLLTGCCLSWNSQSAIGQVNPDQSLPDNSAVSIENDKFIINSGSIRGDNLFHSFSQFSLPPNTTALFDNALTPKKHIR